MGKRRTYTLKQLEKRDLKKLREFLIKWCTGGAVAMMPEKIDQILEDYGELEISWGDTIHINFGIEILGGDILAALEYKGVKTHGKC